MEEASMRRENLDFDSNGTRCAPWWYVPKGEARRAMVVMAHGMGATRELGLDPFAHRFCEAGLCVFAFDGRHHGASDGEPRALLSIARQREGYRAVQAVVQYTGFDLGATRLGCGARDPRRLSTSVATPPVWKARRTS
jgi:uncharacterized protein